MKIRITNGKGWYRDEIGEIFEVTGRVKGWDAYYVKFWKNRWITDSYFVSDGNYEVVEEESAPQSTDDIIANLVRRVAALESQLRDTQNNVERQGVEIANIEAVTKAPQSGAKLLAEAFEALAKYDRSVRE